MPRPAFAYLFERFPSFTQTFTVREVQALVGCGMNPLVYSIRRPVDEPPQDCPQEVAERAQYLPEAETLRSEIRRLKDEKSLPKQVARTLRDLNETGQAADKTRFYEAAWLGMELRRHRIHHVHVHFAGVAARTAWWLKKLYGIAFSFTAHANDFFVRTEHVITLDDLVREAAFIVHVSEYGLHEMAQHFPQATPRMLCVYNGLNLRTYGGEAELPRSLPQAWTQPAAPPLILSIGRLIPKKGFAHLVSACAELRRQSVAFQCAIAGEGPLEQELRAQIAGAGLQDHVLLLGSQPQDEVRRLLAHCKMFALACDTEPDGGMDNLPTVITEAMAYGLPVVSTRLAGVPEQVVHGETGLLAAPGDSTEFAHHLRQLLGDPETARRMGQAGLARASQVFDVHVVCHKLAHALVVRGQARPSMRQVRTRPWLAARLFR